jgi:hypothetical protein
MDMTFKIKPKGAAEDTVKSELVDLIAWEERFEKSSVTLSQGNFFARDYVWLAWHAAHRQGKTNLDFMDWVATLEDIEQDQPTPLELSENPPPTGS